MFHTELNWLVPLRVIKVIKITKAISVGVPDCGFKLKNIYQQSPVKCVQRKLDIAGNCIITKQVLCITFVKKSKLV